MGFEEKLRKLRSQDPWGIEREKEAIRKAEKEKRERIEQLIRNIERLEAVAQEKLRPTLEVVNNLLLEGEGKIKLRTPPKNSRIIEGNWSEQPVSLQLSWNERSWSTSHYDHNSSEGLSVLVVSAQEVEVRGHGKNPPVIAVSLREEDWKQQFEDSIINILNTPDGCYLESSWWKEDRD